MILSLWNFEARASVPLLVLSCVALACSGDDGDTRGSDSGGTLDTTSAGSDTAAGTTTGGATTGTTGVSVSGTETSASTTTPGTGSSTTTSDDETTTGATETGVEEPCPEDCEDMGGVCVGNICCSPDLACGDVCCPNDQVCSFQQCVAPGSVCIDNSDCAGDEYCEFSLGEPAMEGMGECAGGFEPATGKCLPEPPICPPGEEPMEGEDIDCLTECEYVPDGTFTPVVKHHWSAGTVMMAPNMTRRIAETPSNLRSGLNSSLHAGFSVTWRVVSQRGRTRRHARGRSALCALLEHGAASLRALAVINPERPPSARRRVARSRTARTGARSSRGGSSRSSARSRWA